jgi:hypothetical protein
VGSLTSLAFATTERGGVAMGSFARDPATYLDDDGVAVDALTSYFAIDSNTGLSRYAGAWFERLGRIGSLDPDPDRVTIADVLAVEMLSVQVPPHATLWLLGPGAWQIEQLLHAIPKTVPLWTATDEQIGTHSAAWRLWDLLRHRTDQEITGTGPVTTSKLLARKRPLLIPIQDSVVTSALGHPEGGFWTAMREALRDEPLRHRLAHVHATARTKNEHVPESLSMLRVLDIIIWMAEHG